MMKPQPVARWDPRARAGAVAVARKRPLDMLSVSDMADVIMDWASYTSLAGDLDNVETSKVQGNYDWRSYLREEADAARAREAERTKARGSKKPSRAPLPPVPSSLYA